MAINIRKKRRFLCCAFNPHKNNTYNHLYHLDKGLDVFLKHFDKLLILGDLYLELRDKCFNGFSTVNNIKNLNKEPTYFEN